MERFLDDISDTWNNVICVGSGNEGNSAGHVAGRLNDEQTEEVQLAVQERKPALNVQIWKYYVDDVEISAFSPSGVQAWPFKENLGTQRFFLDGTELLIYYGEPKPYSVRQEIYLAFLPRQSYVDSGVWRIVLTPKRIVEGSYQMWLPAQAALHVGTAFLMPDSRSTLTIPSTAALVVTVAAMMRGPFPMQIFRGGGRCPPTRGAEHRNRTWQPSRCR